MGTILSNVTMVNMDFWLGILAILVGLVSCFYGYPLFRVILIFAGLIGGYMIGQSFVQIGPGWLALLTGISVAVILSIFAYPLWSIGVFFVGGAMGFLILSSIAVALNVSQTTMILLGLLGAGVVGLLFFLVRDLFVMLTTALNGAVEVVYGIGLFVPTLALQHGSRNLVALALVIGLCSLGVAVQYNLFKDRRMYSPESKK